MPPPNPAPRPTVLIVDDTPDALQFLTRTLEREGMATLIAVDGLAALEAVERMTPDLILMDAVMPGLDGFETTRRIKANPAFRHVPIVFMTGLTETEHVVRGLGAGGVDFVTKPINIDELLARIRVHLATARATHGSQLALDTSGRLALAIDGGGVPQWVTPSAVELLETLFPDWRASSGELPDALSSALRRIQTLDPAPGAKIGIEVAGRVLEAAFLRRTPADEWLFRIAGRYDGEEQRLLGRQHALTSREAEVLLWISRGKQNREVSEILKISPRTVNKHLEQIFEKMGVENRASAAAIAVATLAR